MQVLHMPWCPYIHAADARERRKPWSMPQRRLAHWLLVTSLDGPESIVVSGRRYEVAAGASYCIQPGQLHDLSGLANRPAWLHFDLVFHRHRANHPLAGAYESELGSRRQLLQPDSHELFGVDLPVLIPAKVGRLFSAAIPRIVALHRRGEALAECEARQRLGDIMLRLVETCQGASRPALDAGERVDRALAAVRAHLDLEWTLPEMASAAGMGRSAFCAAFVTLQRLTPAVWLRHLRMERAAELLRHGDLEVASVGRLVGYGDPTVFSRVFRQHHGANPSQWRRMPVRT